MFLKIPLIALVILPLSINFACGERLLPEASPLEDEIMIIDWDVSSHDDRLDDLAIRSLQGLVNRQKAQIWVGTEMREGSPGWWMQEYQKLGIITHEPRKISRKEFLQEFRSYANGIVVPPANLGSGGYRVAVMRAAADDLIVGSRELAETLGLPVVVDYSERFETYGESWQYALDHLWDKLSGKGAFVDREDLARGTATVDYVVQHKLFLCAPHTAAPEEMDLFRETLSRLPNNGPVLGSVGGTGLYSEGDLIRAVSQAGCVFVGCSAVPNLSLHSALKSPEAFIQPMRERPELDAEKAYIAIEFSDGDNANVFFTHIPRRSLWENRGRIPIGWTISQGMFELAPAITHYFYSTRSPLDEFITGVSGYAYMFPGDFGNALDASKREDTWKFFLDRTDKFLEQSDIRIVTTIHYQEAPPGAIGDEIFERYSSGLKNATGIINGYNAVYHEYDGKTYEMFDGLPVFHTITDRTWHDPEGPTLADDVIARTPEERPAFMALFMLPMALNSERFELMAESIERLEQEGYVLVLPSELAELAREAAGE